MLLVVTLALQATRITCLILKVVHIWFKFNLSIETLPPATILISRSFVIEMNLLKRLFSLGGKKNKKKRAQIVHNVPLPEHDLSGLQANDDLEHEAAVGRLLRSSSARYVETPEPDYATLSPLRKELHDVAI